jgi:serine carboxypeptidase-like clade 2
MADTVRPRDQNRRLGVFAPVAFAIVLPTRPHPHPPTPPHPIADVPTIAAKIVSMNKAGGNPIIPFKGFAVGNAWTVAGLDNTGAVEFWWGHGMVSNASRTGILTTCNMSDIGPIFARSAAVAGARGALGFTPVLTASGAPESYAHAAGGAAQTCDDWQNQAFAEMGNVDIYDIYVDVCPSGGRRGGTAAAAAVPPSLAEGSNGASGCSLSYDPCVDDAVQTYMNRPDVQAAIHANASIKWTDCSSVVNYSRFDLLSSMLPTYSYLLTNAPDARFWVYSGNVDAIVPFTGTRLWLQEFGLPEAEPWRAYTVNGQVGGGVMTYGPPAPGAAGLTFATVRNAGHMVPYTQQERAFYLISQFLAGQPL